MDIGTYDGLVTGYVSVTCVFAVLTASIAKYNIEKTKGWATAATLMIYLYVVW